MEKNNKKSSLGKIVAIMFFSGFVLLIGCLVLGFKYVCRHEACSISSQKPYVVSIKTEEGKGVHVENKGSIFSIFYKVQNGNGPAEDFFNVDTSKFAIQDLSVDLESPFFSCSQRREKKIIYVILDVSKSVVQSAGEDYFSRVTSTIQNILASDSLEPGDQIRIRFMGNNNDALDNLDFTGPRFKYSVQKNSVQKKITLTLTDYSRDHLTKCQNTSGAISLEDVIGHIQSSYEKRIQTPDNTTNISGLLKQISNEVSLEQERFESVRYIIFTDGDSTDEYDGCDYLSADKCGTDIKSLNLNHDLSNRAYVIWVKDSWTQGVFRKLFDGMSVNFQ
ncbi:MAG: hypothetical protein JWM20_868 [Patescibacteria group bacterium]|nr:hypothetical protein [Patescibacteria group bacterium]